MSPSPGKNPLLACSPDYSGADIPVCHVQENCKVPRDLVPTLRVGTGNLGDSPVAVPTRSVGTRTLQFFDLVPTLRVGTETLQFSSLPRPHSVTEFPYAREIPISCIDESVRMAQN
jgi:hypothetical protein